MFLELTQLRNQLRMIRKKWSSYLILLVVNFSCKLQQMTRYHFMEDRRVILSNLFLNFVKLSCELGQIITR